MANQDQSARRAKKKTDYIAFGSQEHANLLGLRKAEQGDTPVWKTWTLVDITMWGPNVTELFLLNQLKQRVNEFEHAPDPKPEGAPPRWEPQPAESDAW
jgi:hypothetical protein